MSVLGLSAGQHARPCRCDRISRLSLLVDLPLRLVRETGEAARDVWAILGVGLAVSAATVAVTLWAAGMPGG